jgi:hypothetical protein
MSTGLVRTLVFMRLFAFLGALCPKMGFAQMVPSLDWTEANTIVEALKNGFQGFISMATDTATS